MYQRVHCWLFIDENGNPTARYRQFFSSNWSLIKRHLKLNSVWKKIFFKLSDASHIESSINFIEIKMTNEKDGIDDGEGSCVTLSPVIVQTT